MPASFPFVGRTRELAQLDEAVERTLAGVGESVLLLGEPGIGKSRLADECADRARARGFAVTWGRCWEAGGAPEFWPWTQALRGLVRAMTPERIDALDPPSSPRRQLLAGLVPELSPTAVRGDADRFELLDAVAGWLTGLAGEPGQPIWIGLEDLHAADSASLALLEFLAPQLRAARIMIVGTARDREAEAETAALARLARCSRQLQLHRLDGDDIRRFLAAAFAQPLSPATEQAVERTTEGNPLFLVEAARLLQALGPSAELTEVLPATVRATVEGRLAKLGEQTRAVLEHAALLGREFDVERLRAAFALDHVEPALREACEAALLIPLASGCYRFAHIRIPEVVALGIAEPTRARLHAAIAASLDGHEGREAELAHHLLRAGPSLREQALLACMRAAEAAHRRFAYEDACAHLERARTLLAELEPELEPRRAAAIACELDTAEGLSLLASGELERGRERCTRAFERAEAHDDGVRMAEAALAYGSEFNLAQVDDLLGARLEAVLARLPSGRPALEARVLARLAAARQPAPDPRGPIDLARRAIAMARESEDEDALAEVLRNGGSAMVDVSDASERIDFDRELYELALRRGRRVDAIRALTRLVFATFELGRMREAWALLDELTTMIRERAPSRLAWRLDALTAMRAMWLGELDRAREAIARVAQASDGEARTVTLFQSLWLARLEDDRERIAEFAPRIRRIFGSSRVGEVLSLPYYGECLVWLGRGDEVAPLVTEEFVDAALRMGDRSGFEALAQLAHASRHRELARALLQRYAEGSQRFIQAGVVGLHLRNSIDYALALAHRTLGEHEQAAAALERAAAFALEHGALVLERRLRAETRDWSTSAADPGPSPAPAPALPRFELRGATWELEFAGRMATVRANKGIAMIAELLRRPGVEVHVLDLVHPGGERARVDEGDAGELLDAKARADYRRRSQELAEQLREAESFNDIARAEQLRELLDALAAELSRGVGLSGSSRRAAGAAERARVNVRKRLRHAISAITEVHPELGRHLDATIRTGSFCEYRPL